MTATGEPAKRRHRERRNPPPAAIVDNSGSSEWVLVDGRARPRWGAEAPTRLNLEVEPAYVPRQNEPEPAKLLPSVLTSEGRIDLRSPLLPKGLCALHLLALGEKAHAYRNGGRICHPCSKWCSSNRFSHLDRMVNLRTRHDRFTVNEHKRPRKMKLVGDETEQERITARQAADQERRLDRLMRQPPDGAGRRKRKVDWSAVEKKRAERFKKVENSTGTKKSYRVARAADGVGEQALDVLREELRAVDRQYHGESAGTKADRIRELEEAARNVEEIINTSTGALQKIQARYMQRQHDPNEALPEVRIIREGSGFRLLMLRREQHVSHDDRQA
jgi:hypothetical protein